MTAIQSKAEQQSSSLPEWFNRHLHFGNRIDKDVVAIAGEFCLVWSFFESKFCDSNANPPTLSRICMAIEIHHHQEDSIRDAFGYFVGRYIGSQEADARFKNLKFSSKLKIEIHRKLNSQPSLKEQLDTCLQIIYRIRNNLFHGNKSHEHLITQTDLIAKAASILQGIMDIHRENNDDQQ